MNYVPLDVFNKNNKDCKIDMKTLKLTSSLEGKPLSKEDSLIYSIFKGNLIVNKSLRNSTRTVTFYIEG